MFVISSDMVERVEQFFENEWTDYVLLWIFRVASELLPSTELRIELFGWDTPKSKNLAYKIRE
jgi:hypothetical protein